MTKDKQIEEMANDYYEAMLKARATLGSMNEGAPKWYAKQLYAKGYRKASDIAREIFEEIDKLLRRHRIEFDMSCVDFYFEKHYAELKKKYTGEDIV